MTRIFTGMFLPVLFHSEFTPTIASPFFYITILAASLFMNANVRDVDATVSTYSKIGAINFDTSVQLLVFPKSLNAFVLSVTDITHKRRRHSGFVYVTYGFMTHDIKRIQCHFNLIYP